MTKIQVQECINDDGFVFLDVRSPKEFAEDHIPGAVNLPILDDEERHIVGYTYKQESKEKAYGIGFEIFGRKISAFEKFLEQNNGKKVVFYCFRGGMRSGCFVDYFKKLGKTVYQLDGGYKSYRQYAREELEKLSLPKKIVVLYGLTGSGKTEIINKLENAIDLEGLARHRSSLFGAVGQTPNSQKMFETLLLLELKKKRDYLILEGESRKIGDVMIPQKLFDAMKNAKKISIICGIDKRTERIVGEYFSTSKRIEEIKSIVPRLGVWLGRKKTEELLKMLDDKNYFDFSKTVLLDYYDPRYLHSIKAMSFDAEVSSEDSNKAKKEIDELCKTLWN